MEDDAPKGNPPADFNKLDLSQLQGFSFGTQWTQEKSAPSDRHDREGGERPRREGAGPDRRDRRTFRRPAGAEGGAAAPAGGPGGPERREFSGDRRPRRDDGGDSRGGPRRDTRGGGGYGYGRRDQVERGPYDSPYYSVTFYPEDTSFNTLVQTIRKSCRTIELFEIARTVVAKTDRFVVVVTHKTPATAASAPRASAEGAPAAAEPVAKPAKPVFYISVPDGMPFETDDAAVAHVLSKHLDKFFDSAEVEVEPPKGNFQVINKCGITGELLGPPNYHRYNQIVQQHYAAKVAGRMGLEAFRSRIETVRDPEVVNQWLAKMKKTTRYTWKVGVKPAPAAVAPTPTTAEESTPAVAPESTSVESTPAENPAPEAPAENAAPAPAALSFDSLEDARVHLLANARDKVVRTSESARLHGKVAEQMPPGEIRRAIEGALERQQRFPLDTANALRGRLRREHFTIFKKGSKGVSYVCAVKRRFRVPGQTFADSIGALITFIETNPMVRASELPVKFLGIANAAIAAKPAAAPAGEAAAATEAPKAEPTLSIDERAKISRLQGDLMWLVREGYVTEFIDGRLFAPPPMVEARKKEVEAAEHDPENFPDAPPSDSSSVAPSDEPSSPMAPPAEPAAAVPVEPASPDTVPPIEPAAS
jgi:hypothetical protein